MAPLGSYSEYSHFLFNLLANRETIESHTISVYTISQTIGITRGSIVFCSGYVLSVFEQIDFANHRILKYMYAVSYQGERVWWYDPMPYPNNPELQSTHPHHKHTEPDIKHHRIPAPGISFTQPNLPQLIAEIEAVKLETS